MGSEVTVIIPMYNAENTIDECLQSIDTSLAKVIVLDDCSTDNSLAKAFQYDVEIHSFNKRAGQGNLKNWALDRVDTRCVMFLDADDYYSKDTIKIMLDAIEGHSLAVCNTRCFGDFERDYGKLKRTGSMRMTQELSMETPCVAWDKIYETHSLVNCRFATTIPEDNMFWFLWCCHNMGAKVNYIDDVLCNYRQTIRSSYHQQNAGQNVFYSAINSSFEMYDSLKKNNMDDYLAWYFETYYHQMIDHHKRVTGMSDENVVDLVKKMWKIRNLKKNNC